MAPLSEAAVFAVQAHNGMRRKQESLEILKNTDDINLLIVWLGDKLANMRSLCREFKEKGSAIRQRSNRKGLKAHARYYTTITELTGRISDAPVRTEYRKLIELVFEKGC